MHIRRERIVGNEKYSQPIMNIVRSRIWFYLFSHWATIISKWMFYPMQRVAAIENRKINVIRALWHRKWPFMMWMTFSRVREMKKRYKCAFVCHFNQIVYSSHIHRFFSLFRSVCLSDILSRFHICSLQFQLAICIVNFVNIVFIDKERKKRIIHAIEREREKMKRMCGKARNAYKPGPLMITIFNCGLNAPTHYNNVMLLIQIKSNITCACT